MPAPLAIAPSLKSFRRQNLLTQFAGLKHVRPDGIYVTLTPGDPTLWSGVLFVRKGPYAPAVLRFRIAYPPNYPAAPPQITFNAELFHPLLTPLTTATYSSALGDIDPAGEHRLPPGSLSLKHGFPSWFIKPKRHLSQDDVLGQPATQAEAEAGIGISTSHENVFVIDMLRYMRSVFEDEAVLDSLPFEAAANPGAWYAWRAHRAKFLPPDIPVNSKEEKLDVSSPRGPASNTPSRPKKPSEWNWDGVWEDRIKKGINGSVSEPALYGATGIRDDEIHFIDASSDDIIEMRSDLHQHLRSS